MAKKIKVTSTIETTLPLSYLEPLQGDLKELSEASEKKLRSSILKHGFFAPFFVWDNPEDGKIYLIDGHQRRAVLLKMKEEGYSLPQFPVVLIDAKDVNEAKEKLAAVASQFGKFTEEGVKGFFKDLTIDFGTIDIPHLDFGNILEPDIDELPPQESVTVSEHERKKVDLDSYNKFEHKCPKCSHEWNDK